MSETPSSFSTKKSAAIPKLSQKLPVGTGYTLTLDDDPLVPKIVERALGIPSLHFTCVQSLNQAMNTLDPLAVFIDVHLETESGLYAIAKLRQRWPHCPFIVITADPSDELVIEALARGADDFIRKPIRAAELKARVQARWNDHAAKKAQVLLKAEDLTVDLAHHFLKGPAGERFLSTTELNLLVRLLEAKGSTVPRQSLKFSCWNQIAVSDNALDRKIFELRRALEDVGSQLQIETVYGSGFALKTEPFKDG